MKKNLLLVVSIFLTAVFICNVNAQPIFQESFDYPAGDTLTNHGWENHSGTGFIFTTTNGGLTYPGLGTAGNAVDVTIGGGSREDVHVNLSSSTTSGSIFASFLVRVDSANSTGTYFIHLADSFGTTLFRGRVFVRDTTSGGGNVQFGLSKASTSTIEWTTTTYSPGVVYLLVLKYEVVGDVSGSDDVVSLFIDPDVTQPEPTPDLTNTDVATDVAIASIALRQGTGGTPDASIRVDEIVIGPDWFDVLPVELLSFTASVSGNSVTLNWATATELNNSGFDILRQAQNSQWEKIAFIPGSGTSTERRSYSYIDNDLASGQYSYRLNQIDFDGSSELSDVVYVDVNNPAQYGLSQNYPNPFNPNTTIKFSIPEASNVTLKVFNTLGEEISVLVNRVMEAGTHEINFDASQLQSGIYFYRIDAGAFSQVKKMTLLK